MDPGDVLSYWFINHPEIWSNHSPNKHQQLLVLDGHFCASGFCWLPAIDQLLTSSSTVPTAAQRVEVLLPIRCLGRRFPGVESRERIQGSKDAAQGLGKRHGAQVGMAADGCNGGGTNEGYGKTMGRPDHDVSITNQRYGKLWENHDVTMV